MSNNIEEFELTLEQKHACKNIENAFKRAKKLGVRFLAKQDSIMAYKKESLNAAAGLADTHNHGEEIPYYPLRNCIDDSGADDMEYFPKGFIE